MIRRACTAGLLLLFVLPLGTVNADDDTLGPTPHATPEAAIERAESGGWRRSREAESPMAADVVGAITPLSGGRVGFMPLLQHHMAVEHWFLEGPRVEQLIKAAAQAGGRGFVRLRGKLTLLGVFGGQGLEWYGNGLQHGREWGPVMGYHERVYRFAVDEVVWVRTRDEQARAQRAVADLNARLQAELERLDYAAATTALAKVVEAKQDAGLDVRGLDQTGDYLRRMLILERDPSTWSAEDKQVVAEAFTLEPIAPYRELKKGARAKLTERMQTWSAAVRDELAPLAVEAWKQLAYRHQRDKARPVVLALDGQATQALAAALLSAEARVEAAKKRLKALTGTADYAGMLAVLDGIAADQALVLDYALADDRTRHWVPAAKHLAALGAVMDDPAKREALMTSQIRRTIAAGTGLPNSNAKPRYNPELIERFAPRLTAAERQRIETLLLEVAKSLQVAEDWKQVLLVAELLSGFGEERARAYFPTLLRQTSRRPQWQRGHLKRFADALEARAGR